MNDELGRIDTSPIQSLSGLRRERAVLAERLAKMSEMQGKVSAEVFERVAEDYRSRLASLEADARPLEAAARREWVKLKQLHHECETAERDAQLAREEIEFRFALGEFDEEAHAAQVEEADRVVGSRRERLEAVGEVREAFLAVFDSEEDLDSLAAESGEAAGPRDQTAAIATADADAEQADESSSDEASGDDQEPRESTDQMPRAPTGEHAASAVTDEDAADGSGASDLQDEQDVEDDDDEPTDVHQLPPPMVGSPGDDFPAPPTFAGVVTTIGPESEDAGEMTVIIRRARLIMLDDGGEPANELMLGTERLSIGRGAENSVRLDDDAVSRQHAAIVSKLGSYVLYDLHSENGTLVNDEPIAERPLTDGDRIQIGANMMVFRAR